MKFNPEIHNRKSIRFHSYDYTCEGLYFITICCYEMRHLFGRVKDGALLLSPLGQIAHDTWLQLPERFAELSLAEFQIMPNHMHGIMVIKEGGRKSLGEMVGAYKSLVFKGGKELCRDHDVPYFRIWQRNYYDHIIRTEIEYLNIAEYIVRNPENWQRDCYY